MTALEPADEPGLLVDEPLVRTEITIGDRPGWRPASHGSPVSEPHSAGPCTLPQLPSVDCTLLWHSPEPATNELEAVSPRHEVRSCRGRPPRGWAPKP